MEKIEDKVLFSIIIPVYNVEDYLKECIDSVLQQDETSYEVILIDDGSTDRSGIMCDVFASNYKRIKCYHKENGGLSSARNYGIPHSNGQYLYFLDSDDYIRPGALAAYRRVVENNEDVDVIIESRLYLDRNGEISYANDYKGGKKFGKKNGREALKVFLNGDQKYSAFGKCFRREFWTGNGFKFREGVTSEDLELIYKVVYKASCVMLTEEAFYVYRMNRSGSIMTNFSEKNIRDLLIVFESWEEFIREEKPEELIEKGIRGLLGNIYFVYVLCEYKNIDRQFKKTDLMKKANQYRYLLANSKYNGILKNTEAFSFPSLVRISKIYRKTYSIKLKFGHNFNRSLCTRGTKQGCQLEGDK